MPLFALGFLFGNVFLNCFSELPDKHFLLIFALLIILLWIILRNFYTFAYFLPAFLIGFIWIYYHAHTTLAWELPKSLENKVLQIKGEIASLPQIDSLQNKFIFHLTEMEMNGKRKPSNTYVLLTFRHPNILLHAGGFYQFVVKLKRIHSLQNSGNYDFEAWALQKGIRASGRIMSDAQNQLLCQPNFSNLTLRLRAWVREKITPLLPDHPTSKWLLALMIGDRSGIPPSEWQILRQTGTNHLMVIAGLHIGVLAGLVHLLVRRTWCLYDRLALAIPAQQVAGCIALVAAILYSALAGFSIPTQRACMMLSIFTCGLFFFRKVNPWHCWSLALLVTLIIQPLAVLTEGLWLSFITIAIIIYTMRGRLAPLGWWWKWGRVQWCIAAGLFPLTAFFFQEYSFVAFFANTLAIPLLAFLILPFCFISLLAFFFFPSLAKLFLMVADQNLVLLWKILTWFSHFELSAWHYTPSHFVWFAGLMIGIVLLLAPSGFPGKGLSLIWFIPVIFSHPELPKKGEVWLTALDIGQGLSVIVKTKTHVLVYDTGAKFNENADMGKNIVIPYLYAKRTDKIDMIVISHDDNDHIGGLHSVLEVFPGTTIKTSSTQRIHFSNVHPCEAGDTWVWDEVRFTFIYPDESLLAKKNDRSCVLLIDNGKHRILLPGDIEKFAERRLLKNTESLSADILLAPHHGSKTSALPSFVKAVSPRWVIYSTGYLNRYHFPHPSVVKMYQDIKACQLNTTDQGEIFFKIGQNNEIASPVLYRTAHKHYWYEREN